LVQAYLYRAPRAGVACIVSDVRMPGLGLQPALAATSDPSRRAPGAVA
jgi:FixJ family two-component response regulator